MKLINEIKLKPGFNDNDLINAICKKTKIKPNQIKKYEIVKMGLDARRKPHIFYVLNVAIETEEKLSLFADVFPDHKGLEYDKMESNIKQPVVVGFGPSGMFVALALALAGLKPIVLEQGKCVEERIKDVENFWASGELNEFSNVQFGEGGAGTFSDGKLNTTLNNEYCKKVLNEFILNGAPKEIYYKNKAHIGTDNLRNVVKNIREKILKNDGKIIFNAKFTNFDVKNAQITNVQYLDLLTNKLNNIETNNLILAIGHSAFSTFQLLKKKEIKMQKKPFAVGVRIEHPQKLINLAQYGCDNENLPAADYKLVVHLPNGRSVFTFCMCPGGRVVASNCEKNSIVTNGMSNFARNEHFANSALLVNVTPEDFKGEDVLEGFYFQHQIEQKAFNVAGKNYNAPAQSIGSFLYGEKQNRNITTSYKPNITFCNLNEVLPQFVVDSLKQAIPILCKKLKGFDNINSVLIAPETRSSCPIQIIRDDKYMCSVNGLLACGEGAGYAGGIISSAVDGIKCAEKIINLIKSQ